MQCVVIGMGPFGGAMTKLLSLNTTLQSIACVDLEATTVHDTLVDYGLGSDHRIDILGSNNDEADYHDALISVDLIVVAVGSVWTIQVLDQIEGLLRDDTIVLNVSKGLMPSGETFGQAWNANNYNGIPAVLSGGMAAYDVKDGVATGAMIVCRDGEVLQQLHDLFSSSLLHVQTTHDMTGVSYAGVLKNLLSIQCGYMSASGKSVSEIDISISHCTTSIQSNATTLGIDPATYDHTYARDHPDYGDIATSCYGGTRNFKLGQQWSESGHLQTAIEVFAEQGITVEGAKTLKLLQTIPHPLKQLPRVQSLLSAYSHD